MTLVEQFTKSLKLFLLTHFDGNMSQMARVTGIHRNQIDRYISGANSPNLETIDALAVALKISPFELLGLENFMKQKPSEAQATPSIWDAINKIQKDIEALKSGETSKSDFLVQEGPAGYLLPEFEKLAEEIERDLGAGPKEKRGRKKGNG
jgi:transcriptional regulator with XRE-family HTH domain